MYSRHEQLVLRKTQLGKGIITHQPSINLLHDKTESSVPSYNTVASKMFLLKQFQMLAAVTNRRS